MSLEDLRKITGKMDPEEALSALAAVAKDIFPLLGEEAHLKFVMRLTGEAGKDKISSLVHLWLAECMDEGVDPTHMCQSLVDKVFQSKQLKAVADPEILVLFEDWLEELEEEIISEIKKTPAQDPAALAEGLGLSKSGTTFLITKLQREGRI